MNITKTYQLWYTGAAEHEILNETKRHIKINTALVGLNSGVVTGKQMAERILDNVAFTDSKIDQINSMSGQFNYSLSKLHTREIDKVHHIKENEIKATWDMPEITEQQLTDALFTDAVEPLLNTLPSGTIDVIIGK